VVVEFRLRRGKVKPTAIIEALPSVQIVYQSKDTRPMQNRYKNYGDTCT
jgi:hypothetical protein